MVNYAYNGDDQRVGQGSGGALTGELYAGASAGSPLLQNGVGTYTPGVSQHGTGGSAYFAADALGSTRGITGSTGVATDALQSDAFGETLTRSGSTAQQQHKPSHRAYRPLTHYQMKHIWGRTGIGGSGNKSIVE